MSLLVVFFCFGYQINPKHARYDDGYNDNHRSQHLVDLFFGFLLHQSSIPKDSIICSLHSNQPPSIIFRRKETVSFISTTGIICPFSLYTSIHSFSWRQSLFLPWKLCNHLDLAVVVSTPFSFANE